MIVKEIVGEEKIKDLTSKNPQLKELGDLAFERVPEPSPEPSPRILQQQDSDAPRVSCLNLSSLFSCFRSPQS